MKKKSLLFLVLLLSVACDSDSPAPQTPFTPIVINFDVMNSGHLSTAASDILPGNYLITSQNDWNIFVTRINNAYPFPTPTFESTINFNEFIV